MAAFHRFSRLLTKLDARDRAQLVVIAYQSRLARPGPISWPAPAPTLRTIWTSAVAR